MNPRRCLERSDSDPFNGTYQPGISRKGCTPMWWMVSPLCGCQCGGGGERNGPPGRGTNATVEVCSTDASFSCSMNLAGHRTVVVPGPPRGRRKQRPVHPGTSTAGTTPTRWPGAAPRDSSAVIAVIVNPAPDAGEDATVTVCEDEVQWTSLMPWVVPRTLVAHGPTCRPPVN